MVVFVGNLAFYLFTVSTVIPFDVLTTPVISPQGLMVPKGLQVSQGT